MLKTSLCLLALLLLAAAVHAQTVQLTVPGGQLHPGEIVMATARVTNSLPARAPIVVTIDATYTDWTGAPLAVSPVSATMQVIQPLTFNKLALNLGSQLAFETGSANAVVPVTAATSDGTLTFGFSKTLLESESMDITFRLKVAQ